MRREELEIIRKLERNLSVTTHKLATIGRDLLLFRQHLVNQEDEYNNRFGADPSVAVLRPLSPKKRPATAMTSKRLPKLTTAV
jgi:hypothetical protein